MPMLATAAVHPFPHSFPDGLPFAFRNQAAQTIVEKAHVGTVPIAFEGRNQALVSKVDFSFVASFRDFKNDFGALPLGFVFGEVEVVVQNKPHDFMAGNEFYVTSCCKCGNLCSDT